MSAEPIVVERSTVVAAPRAEVWAVAVTFAGVNAELMPLCKMVEPRSLRGRTIDTYQPGERASCWLLAFGVLPFDRHHLGLESIADGEGFVEESTSWVQRRWRHERTLVDQGTGTRVTDRITVVPRLWFARPVAQAVVGRIFTHRHRRLVQRFGAVASASAAA